MRADDYIDLARGELRQGFVEHPLMGESSQVGDANRPVGKAVEEVLVVLLGE